MKLLLDTDIGNDIDDAIAAVDADAFFRIWFGALSA